MLKSTGAEEDYIKYRQTQLNNYRKQYVNFLDDTGRTRITANEWMGSMNGALVRNTKKAKEDVLVIKNKEVKIPKKEYGKLTHTIDSNPDKWIKNKINRQIIGDTEYYFEYNDFNDFKVIGRIKIDE